MQGLLKYVLFPSKAVRNRNSRVCSLKLRLLVRLDSLLLPRGIQLIRAVTLPPQVLQFPFWAFCFAAVLFWAALCPIAKAISQRAHSSTYVEHSSLSFIWEIAPIGWRLLTQHTSQWKRQDGEMREGGRESQGGNMHAKEVLVHIIPYHSIQAPSFLPNSQGHGAVRKRDTSSCTIVPCLDGACGRGWRVVWMVAILTQVAGWIPLSPWVGYLYDFRNEWKGGYPKIRSPQLCINFNPVLY